MGVPPWMEGPRAAGPGLPAHPSRDGDKLIIPKGSAPGDAAAVGAQPNTAPHVYSHTHTQIYIYIHIYLSIFPLFL